MTNYNGILFVDKPTGITSHDVVFEVRKQLQMKSVGHAGTLDPLATGLMIVLLGEATKISDYLLNGDKAYQCKLRLGVDTDTLDRTGTILRESANIPMPEKIREAILTLKGKFDWEIPIYSAKKVDGKKLYEYAREEKEIELPRKTMEFRAVEILEVESPFVSVYLHCSKGSFIRSWVSELGKLLGCGATMEELRRVESSPYFLKQAISLDEVGKYSQNLLENAAFMPLNQCLGNFPTLEVEGLDEKLISNGQVSQNLKARLKILEIYQNAEERSEKWWVRIMSREKQSLLALVEPLGHYNYKISRGFRS